MPVLIDVLHGLGARTEVFEPAMGRTSVLATIGAGDQSRPTLLINGHVDVVAVREQEWAFPPFGGVVQSDRLFGRGACDMKGGIASAIEGYQACIDAGITPACDVVFHLVADEETGGKQGTAALVEAGRIVADAAIVPEPSELSICVAERGALLAEITVTGRATHGSDPAAGHSAIADAARLVNALHLADFGGPSHTLLGSPTCNVGTIAGGTMPNVVASSCTLQVDRRVLPGQTRAESVAAVQKLLARDAPDIDYALDVLTFVEASELSAEHPFVEFILEAGAGAACPVRGFFFGTDARFLRNQLGIPTVVYGPGSMSIAHTADEHVLLAELTAAARTFAAVYATYGRAAM